MTAHDEAQRDDLSDAEAFHTPEEVREDIEREGEDYGAWLWGAEGPV